MVYFVLRNAFVLSIPRKGEKRKFKDIRIMEANRIISITNQKLQNY